MGNSVKSELIELYQEYPTAVIVTLMGLITGVLLYLTDTPNPLFRIVSEIMA